MENNTTNETRSEIARRLFREGYNCSQAVLCAFCDEINMTFEEALKLSSSFGGGMGRMREVCGAVSSIFMVAGIKYGYTSNNDDERKGKHYALIQQLGKDFKQKHNTLICRELLGLDEDDNPIPSKRIAKYYEERPCEMFVGDAAQIIENLITKQNGGNNMKIAIASDGKFITEHFGHCENFIIYDVENGEIIKRSSVPNPGHKPGFLPKYLKEIGVTVIISGGMGGGAVDLFKENGIQVEIGALGESDAAAKAFIAGTLVASNNVCHEHKNFNEVK